MRPCASEVTTLLAKLGYRGILDLDIRLDERTGDYHLLDFNPRLGAQFRVFRDTAGTDVALAAYLDLTNQPIPPGEQVNGRRFLVENYDPISALAHIRHGDLTPRAWLVSMRAVDETAWFARDDLRPFGLMCLRMSWRLASRPFGQDASRPFATGLAAPRPIRPVRGSSGVRQGGDTSMSDVDVAIIGAGPYGLSLAAHLQCGPRQLPSLRRADAAVARGHARRACSSSRRASPPTSPTRRARTPWRPSARRQAVPTRATGSRYRWTLSSATASGSSPNST